MIIHDTDSNKYNIDIPSGNGEYQSTCPKCSHDRKPQNQKKKCFSWNRDKDTGYCHNCDTRFQLIKSKKEYIRPEWKNSTELSDNVVKWFEGRGIKQFTLREMKVSEGVEWMPQHGKEMNTIQFNFFRDGELINIKYRSGDKGFKMHKDSELIFYNLDGIKDTEDVYIVEGEMDALSLFEVGIRNVVSVPNGASAANMEYLDNCIDYFEDKKRIILATDDDIPGVKLRDELANRLGIERCYKIKWKGEKDANDVLIKHGKDQLLSCLNNPIQFPVEGVVQVNDLTSELDVIYSEGFKKGAMINVPEFDELISLEKKRLMIVSGIPSHGKSTFVDFWLAKLNLLNNWKIGYFSPENFPVHYHIANLLPKISGKDFREADPILYRNSVEYMNDNYFFVRPEKDYTIDSVLSKAKYLKSKYGIDAFVIDPYNRIDHQMGKGENETTYISKVLDKLTNFAQRNDILMILVAHPKKMNKGTDGTFEIPTLYDIAGSANFYNKADYGVCVYRNMEQTDSGLMLSNKVEVHIQKVKFRHLGQTGMCRFAYNINNGRYATWSGDDINTINYDNSSWLLKKQFKEIENDDITQQIDNVPF